MYSEKKYPYANYVAYYGNKEKLKKYEAALLEAGFKKVDTNTFTPRTKGVINVISYLDGEYGFYNHKGSGEPLVFTSDQFAEALAAATKPAE